MECVKLYYSTNDDDWEDKGTGFFKFNISDKTGCVLISEEDSSGLLTHEITVKRTPELFLGPRAGNSSCTQFWEWRPLQRGHWKAAKEPGQRRGCSIKPLPDLTLTSLESMTKMFEDVPSLSKDSLFSPRHFTFQALFLSELEWGMEQCEDLKDIPSLENCCRLVWTLVLHADFSTAEALFSEEPALHIIGALEYCDGCECSLLSRHSSVTSLERFKSVIQPQKNGGTWLESCKSTVLSAATSIIASQSTGHPDRDAQAGIVRCPMFWGTAMQKYN